jgi:hypothetical protein
VSWLFFNSLQMWSREMIGYESSKHPIDCSHGT